VHVHRLLYGSIFSYPSLNMYDDIVDGILREYPYIAKATGLSSSAARVSTQSLHR